MSEKQKIVSEIAEALLNLEEEKTLHLVKDALNRDENPLDILDGLTKGIREVGEKFSNGEVFLTDLMMSGVIMNQAVEILEPKLKGLSKSSVGKVVMGTIEGDIHDIGKNIVIVLLQASGFEVHDLGKDVPIAKFIEKIKEYNPDIVGASSLLTTTMEKQRQLVKAIIDNGLRDKVKIMVGGAPVTEEWVKEIEADAYGTDAIDAVKKAKELIDN